MAKTIMIVDDSAPLRQVVAIALKSAGYNVIEACDGKDALSKLNGSRFNLIISDVNMPNMDGVTLLSEIKKLPDHQSTPVIMLTTEGGDEMKRKGKEAGAKEWVVKPFKPDQMLDAVSRLIA